MLDTPTTDTSPKAVEAPRPLTTAPALPRLCSIKRARAEWGDCGTTRFYEIVREHNVRLLKMGSKTVIAGEDVNSVADAIIAAAPREASIDAKALASRSVDARRAGRGGTPAQPATAPSHPVATRRRRRGSAEP